MQIKLSELKSLITEAVNKLLEEPEEWSEEDQLLAVISDKYKELNGFRPHFQDMEKWSLEDLKKMDADLQSDLERMPPEEDYYDRMEPDRAEDYPVLMNLHKIPEPDDEPAKKQIARLSPAAKSPGRLVGGTQPWRQGEKKNQTRAQRRLSKALAKDY
jgi:hypothetical protein